MPYVEFVVGSLLCSERFFSRYSGFPLSLKTNISKFQFDPDFSGRIATLWMCHCKLLLLLFYSCYSFEITCIYNVVLIFVFNVNEQ